MLYLFRNICLVEYPKYCKYKLKYIVVNSLLIRANSVATCAVVSQVYDTDVNKEYVIRGNAAVLKCQVPSFVADFVTVVSWHTDLKEDFYPSSEFGNFFRVGSRTRAMKNYLLGVIQIK